MANSDEAVEPMLFEGDAERGVSGVGFHGAAPWRRSVAMGLAAAAAAACCAAPLLRGGGGAGPLAAAQVSATQGLAAARHVPPGLKCEVPADFCATDPNREDFLSFRDCDGDGHLDAYCSGGQLLRFGYISSARGCENTWPNGVCTQETESHGASESTPAKAAGHEVTIIHFNDVYEVSGVLDGGVRRGGMSRAAHVIEIERRRNPERTFVVFAGDVLSPSALSNLFEGKQMIDVLNSLTLDAASLGNHEFDFGVPTMLERLKESKFPWLNVNLVDANGKLFEGTQPSLVKDIKFTPLWGEAELSTKVCLLGAAYDVRETMFKDKELVGHLDTINASKAEVKRLREQGCKIVLALTHQFSRDDCAFSKALGKDVDLILGGHDHSTEMTTVCGHAPFVKADSDLKTQWIMTLWLNDEGKVLSTDGRLISLTDADPFSESLHNKVLEWEVRGEKELNKPIGCSSVALDATSSSLRRREMVLGNLFTDAVRAQHKTDVAMINGGTIRGNKVFEAGALTKKMITMMHPYGNSIVKVYMKGSEIRQYINKQLDCYEDPCGNFVQISGLKYSFDATAPRGQRLKSLTHYDDTPVDDKATFTVAMSNFMLANSPYSHNKLYNMVTLNDGVPIVSALFEEAKAAGESCVQPKLEGRITSIS